MELFGTAAVVHGGTYNANTMSCAAALAVVRHLRAHEATIYGGLREAGTRLQEGLREAARRQRVPLLVQGLPTVFHTLFTARTASLSVAVIRRAPTAGRASSSSCCSRAVSA